MLPRPVSCQWFPLRRVTYLTTLGLRLPFHSRVQFREQNINQDGRLYVAIYHVGFA